MLVAQLKYGQYILQKFTTLKIPRNAIKIQTFEKFGHIFHYHEIFKADLTDELGLVTEKMVLPWLKQTAN